MSQDHFWGSISRDVSVQDRASQLQATTDTEQCLTSRGNHLVKSTSQEKISALSLVFATLEIEYAKQFRKETWLR